MLCFLQLRKSKCWRGVSAAHFKIQDIFPIMGLSLYIPFSGVIKHYAGGLHVVSVFKIVHNAVYNAETIYLSIA